MRNFTTKDMIDFIAWFDSEKETESYNTYEEELNEWMQLNFCTRCNNTGFVYRDSISNVKRKCSCKLPIDNKIKQPIIQKMESYNDKLKKFEKETLFLETMYGISRDDFETALTPLHYLEAMEEYAKQMTDEEYIATLPLPEDVEVEAKLVLRSMHIARQNRMTREPGEWTDEELLNGLKLMCANYRKYLLKPV